MCLKTALILLVVLAGCDGNVPAVAVDGGAPGPDARPARACLPIPPAPGVWQPVQARAPNSFGQLLWLDEALFVIDESFHRLLRSDDHGATWCFVPTPSPLLAIFPGKEALYGIPDDSSPPGAPSDMPPVPPAGRPQPLPPSRLLRSDDGGDTWKNPGGMLPREPRVLAPWSSDPQEMVAILGGDLFASPPRRPELWLTRDGGGHWEAVKPDGPTPDDPLDWRWVARSLRDSTTLVALAQAVTDTPDSPFRIQGDWLWTSTDEGLTWTRIADHGPCQDALLRDDGTVLGLTNSGDVFAGDPKALATISHLALLRASFQDGGPGKLYVQGLRDLQVGPISTLETSDGGHIWTTVSDDYIQRIPLSWWKGTSLELSAYGLRASDDAGKTWRNLLLPTAYTSFAGGGGAHFLTNGVALLRDTDEAGVWTGTPFLDRSLGSFLPDPRQSDSAYAVIAARGPTWMPSPSRTTDGGKTWQPLSITVDGKPLARASIAAIAPTTPPALFAVGEDAVVRSVDGGATWARLDIPSVSAIRPAPSDPNVVYAALRSGWVMVSNNGGADWIAGLDPLAPGAAIDDLVIDPTDAQTVFAIQRGPLSLSTDGGMTWQRLRIFLKGGVNQVALRPTHPGTLFYVDAANGYVAETTDLGMSGRWFQPPGAVSGLAIDPTEPELLYLTSDAGAFVRVLR
jgi:photosystem II stability/assembly factor-like uncharacterized protein